MEAPVPYEKTGNYHISHTEPIPYENAAKYVIVTEDPVPYESSENLPPLDIVLPPVSSGLTQTLQ